MIKYSIIIPAKNEGKYLPRTLDSIKMQNLGDLEIIVALSPETKDNTREIASAYGCRIVEGGLPAEARNNGAKASFGDTFIFIDSDSVMPENFLSKAIQEFNEKDLDVAGTLQYPISTKKGFVKLRHEIYINFFTNYFMKLAENTKKPFMQTCMFAKRKVHEAVKFNETLEFGEDSDYAKRARGAGFNFGLLKDTLPIGFSMRRFEENEVKTLAKNVYFILGKAFGHEFIKGRSRIKYF